MKVLPSSVAEIAIHGCDSPEFHAALPGILGRAPRELLEPALPFSVIVENKSEPAVALLGVRFDMTGPKGTQYSVVHYADTLRNPEKADFLPGQRAFHLRRAGLHVAGDSRRRGGRHARPHESRQSAAHAADSGVARLHRLRRRSLRRARTRRAPSTVSRGTARSRRNCSNGVAALPAE